MYNYFGLKFQNIVNLFSGEVENFATEGMNDGRTNIEDEMDIQIGKLLAKIPANVLRLFEFVENVKVDQELEYITGVGSRFRFPDGIPPVVPSVMEGTIVQKNKCISVPVLNLGISTDNDCNNFDLCGFGTSFTVGIVSGSNGEFFGWTNEDIDLTQYDAYLSYEVDSDSEYFQIKELKGILRDMVACTLGSRLLMENENKWRILDIVCATTFDPPKNWIPAEFRKLKWWRKPWADGLIIGKLGRV